MLLNKDNKNVNRKARHSRVRKKIQGTPERPRLNIYRSGKHMYAQLIDDVSGHTLASASTLDKEFSLDVTNNKEAAREVGKLIGERAVKANIKNVVFDRSGYIYHGRVKELADGAREAGLNF